MGKSIKDVILSSIDYLTLKRVKEVSGSFGTIRIEEHKPMLYVSTNANKVAVTRFQLAQPQGTNTLTLTMDETKEAVKATLNHLDYFVYRSNGELYTRNFTYNYHNSKGLIEVATAKIGDNVEQRFRKEYKVGRKFLIVVSLTEGFNPEMLENDKDFNTALWNGYIKIVLDKCKEVVNETKDDRVTAPYKVTECNPIEDKKEEW